MNQPWPKVKLGEVLQRRPLDVTVDVGTEYDFAGVYCFGRGVFRRESRSGGQFSYRQLTRLKAGNFVYPKLMAWEGAFGLVPQECDGCCVSPEFPVFAVNPERLMPEFLGHYFRIPRVWEEVSGGSTGTNVRRRRLNPGDLLTREFPLPPLAEQRRVVARIEELAAQIHKARTLRQQATEEAEALTKSALSRKLTVAAEKYGVQPMGEVAKCAAGFGFPKQYQGRTDLKYPFAKVSDMNIAENQRAITTARNSVGDEDVRELQLKIYPVGTIIFPKIGGAIATNKRRVLSVPATFDNNVMGLIPSDKLLSEYLFVFMQSFDLTELQAGTSVPAISQGKVEAMKIPVPPLPDQRRIVAELDALQAQVDALKRLQAETAAELAALLPAILDRAFRGAL